MGANAMGTATMFVAFLVTGSGIYLSLTAFSAFAVGLFYVEVKNNAT